MRTFSSYGPIDTDLHYYAPRKETLDFVHRQLLGRAPEKDGHYITVWGPRQTGKTWALNQIFSKINSDERFDAVKVDMEPLKTEKNVGTVLSSVADEIAYDLEKDISGVETPEQFQRIFLKETLDKPLVLILDEFDALEEEVLSAIVGVFRNIYNVRQRQADKKTGEKKYLLHSAALIGVRSALGIENQKGSPFNVQRSVHIPNLTSEEVEGMFRWHERESGQKVEREVIERLFYETQGQPGLVCWFGELLTEGWDQFRVSKDMPVDMALFEEAWLAAVSLLPNNNILNIISKAKQEPYKDTVLELFGTGKKMLFEYDDPLLNFLYMNGVIDIERGKERKIYAKFSSPFVQKRLFSHFAREIHRDPGMIYDPFEDMEGAVAEDSLDIVHIIKRYQTYLIENRDWALKNAPRRSDLRIYEAVFHFNLYKYLSGFLESFKGEIYPEFPTGNGKIDLIVRHAGRVYGIEVKTFKNRPAYFEALAQAALYGKQLGLEEITLVFFIEKIDDANRAKYEVDFLDEAAGVKVLPVFVETG
ncbi:conserved hypothetical protein [Candidatus Desulfarcum epimagneticum]|uniref:AAA+ ATPase domain-containing protein n=1 Tax=uncultured Desulfobacteraceae bacterium TaxID=218296 RepID=A0A484HHY7_9BACT|nr:conserved hypothetical protein [uncultured Desulfobacteraceae bacterium]